MATKEREEMMKRISQSDGALSREQKVDSRECDQYLDVIVRMDLRDIPLCMAL
jgi:hypothetical protein